MFLKVYANYLGPDTPHKHITYIDHITKYKKSKID